MSHHDETQHPRARDGRFAPKNVTEQDGGMDSLTYLVQAASHDRDDAADAVRVVADQIERGVRAGFYEGTWDFGEAKPGTARPRIAPDAPVEYTVEVSAPTKAEVVSRLRRIADQIGDGAVADFDVDDDGHYAFTRE